jgi:DNA sulfur modification protein DndC
VYRDNIFGQITNEIREVYLADERPWIIAFSGGKDSTALLQLVYKQLLNLPKKKHHKHIYIVASDTLVEIPQIQQRISKEIKLINEAAASENLPLSAHIVAPVVNDTFWVCMIGRGYVSPNYRFRWCMDRLKIRPSNRFVREKVDVHGEVLILLGSRKAESASRSGALIKNTIKNSRFKKHGLKNAFSYTPIEELTTKEIWTYLRESKNPWGSDNDEVISLYKQANGECPVIADKSSPVCGQSRFGCWVCTVVKKDVSFENLLGNNGHKLRPLNDFRNHLHEIRNNPDARYTYRRNGQLPKWNGKILEKKGPFTHEAREKLLEDVLGLQEKTSLQIISSAEIDQISRVWDTEEKEHPER